MNKQIDFCEKKSVVLARGLMCLKALGVVFSLLLFSNSIQATIPTWWSEADTPILEDSYSKYFGGLI